MVRILGEFFFSLAQQPNSGQGHLTLEFSASHKHTTVGKICFDEGLAPRRDLYLTTHNTHKKETSMPPAGFDTSVPASKGPLTLALDHLTTGIGRKKILRTKYLF
jgi:hypothetical protein